MVVKKSIIVAAGLRTGTRRKKIVPRLFFNTTDTSHHCRLYHYNIILHSLEAFEACRLI